MLNPEIYPLQKVSLIVEAILTNVGLVGLFICSIFLIFRYKKKWLPIGVVLIVISDLLLLGRGNLFYIPLPTVNLPKLLLQPVPQRYISTVDFTPYFGPHVYFNQLRVRQFEDDIKSDELDTFDRFKQELSQLPANMNLLYPYANVSGYSAIVLDSYAQYWNSEYINSISIQSLDDARIHTMGVTHAITGFPTDVVTGNDGWELVSPPETPLVYKRTLPQERAFLVRNGGTAEITRYTQSSVEVSTTTLQSDALVLTDNVYPGWKAYVDGEPVELLTHSGVFRMVEVPKGEHTVTFRYRPDSVRIGLVLTLTSTVHLLLLLTWPKQK